MWYPVYLGAFLAGLAACLALTPPFRRLALRLGVVDRPAARKVHRVPTPMLGGAAVFLSFLVVVLSGLALFFLAGRFLPPEFSRHLPGAGRVMPRLFLVLGGGALIFTFGLIDDFRGVSAIVKLAVQASIALLLFQAGLRVSVFVANPLVSLLLTVGWVVFITNSFNLLDNMDGLSAGVALVGAFLFFLHAARGEAYFIATLLAVFLGSVLGFLRYNVPPARIFLGEAGSRFLGFFLAAVVVMASFYEEGDPSRLPVLAPLFFLAIPIYDTLSVIVIRSRAGRSVFTPGKDHFSHRLVACGLSPRRAVGLIHLLALGLGLPALTLKNLPFSGGLILLGQAVILLAVISLVSVRGEECHQKN